MILSKLLFLNLGGGEIFVILLVVLLFFGSKRIPELAKGLGKGMREFKDAMSGIENEVRNAASDTPSPALIFAGSSLKLKVSGKRGESR